LPQGKKDEVARTPGQCGPIAGENGLAIDGAMAGGAAGSIYGAVRGGAYGLRIGLHEANAMAQRGIPAFIRLMAIAEGTGSGAIAGGVTLGPYGALVGLLFGGALDVTLVLLQQPNAQQPSIGTPRLAGECNAY
jgi:hypothetical protein